MEFEFTSKVYIKEEHLDNLKQQHFQTFWEFYDYFADIMAKYDEDDYNRVWDALCDKVWEWYLENQKI